MQIHTSSISLKETAFQNALKALSGYPLDNICFFDIETTGLSADISSLYLIGCGHFEQNEKAEYYMTITQWFADDYVSECELLTAFADFLQNFSYVFHYNGIGFDIPYLEKKYRSHHIESPFSDTAGSILTTIDLYKQLRPFKKIFPLPNLKLISLEHFLHIKRQDTYSGKDCIELYVNYMKYKYYREKSTQETCQKSLLLHNHDDITGTFLCSQILLYLTAFSPENISSKYNYCTAKIENSVLFYRIETAGYFPSSFSYQGTFGSQAENFSLKFKDNMCQITLPLHEITGYYFFPDYKNYYYLPAEDAAIHKSVAQFVPAAHRIKATSKNCYTKKEGLFLELPSLKSKYKPPRDFPLFYSQDKSRCYIEWNGALPDWYLEYVILSLDKR